MCIFTGALFISVQKEKHSKCPSTGEGMDRVKSVSLQSITTQQQRHGELRQASVWTTPYLYAEQQKSPHTLRLRVYGNSRKGHTKRRPVVSGLGVRTAQGLSLCRVMEVFYSWTGLHDSANLLNVTVNLEVCEVHLDRTKKSTWEDVEISWGPCHTVNLYAMLAESGTDSACELVEDWKDQTRTRRDTRRLCSQYKDGQKVSPSKNPFLHESPESDHAERTAHQGSPSPCPTPLFHWTQFCISYLPSF